MDLFVNVRRLQIFVDIFCPQIVVFKVKHGDFEKSEDLLWQAAEGMFDIPSNISNKTFPQSNPS